MAQPHLRQNREKSGISLAQRGQRIISMPHLGTTVAHHHRMPPPAHAMHFILKCSIIGYNAGRNIEKGIAMDCFALLILISTAAALPAPTRGPRAAFPTKTTSWELTDALAELRDPQSTVLERQVARMRLEQLGAPAVPALQRVAAGDPSREVRAQAEIALAAINGRPVNQATAEPLKGTFPFINITSPDDALAQLRSLLAQARSGLLEEALQ